MPLVFVHGVATRQTPAYQTEVAQRDALFRRLVVGEDDPIWDPDWGSGAVRFGKGGWVPRKGAAQAWVAGTPLPSNASSAAALMAPRDLEGAVDLALGALLAQRAAAGAPLSDDELAAFEAAVSYLEEGADPTAFNPVATDEQFAATLVQELGIAGTSGRSPVAMGGSSLIGRIGQAVRAVTDPLRNAGADAVLKLIREPISNQVALFLGDIFVYLRARDSDPGRIFDPIIKALSEANAARSETGKLIVVGHSLGAVILYDLLSSPPALERIATASGRPLQVDAWVTVGAQPGLFADMGLYAVPPEPDGRLAKPDCVGAWMNVYDFTDVLSFLAKPFFTDVEDFEFDNVSGALEAHTAYFQRPGFYKRLRARLG